MQKTKVSATGDIAARIKIVRGQRVLLDVDLAQLYGVATKALNQAVRRNIRRFPQDFVFQLEIMELRVLRSQFVTLDIGRGSYSKYRPMVFTEHGAIMAATVLSSSRAIEMSVYVVRAFVKLRQILASNTEFASKLAALEKSVRRGLPSDSGADGAGGDEVTADRILQPTSAVTNSRGPVNRKGDAHLYEKVTVTVRVADSSARRRRSNAASSLRA